MATRPRVKQNQREAISEQWINSLENIGNRLILLNFAERMGCDAVMLSQKLFIIKGKPGIEAQLKIALFNSSGRFTPIKFKHENENTDTWKCTAYCKEKESGELLEFTLGWDTVKRERWLDKPGTKWKSIPAKMMMYRSASWLIDIYAPELALGMPTRGELIDMPESEPITVTSDLEQKILDTPPGLAVLTPAEPTMKTHKLNLSQENEFICKVCGFQGASKRGLAKHMTQSHPPAVEKEPQVTLITDEQKEQLETFIPEPEKLHELAFWHLSKPLAEYTSHETVAFILNFDELYQEWNGTHVKNEER